MSESPVPVSSPVQGEAVEPVADTEAVETARRVPEESYTITTECRANRGDGGAWDEAVARLRVVYNAQLARFGPGAVYRLEFHREPAPGVPRYVYDAARDSRPVALPTARDGESDPEDYCHRCGGPNEYRANCDPDTKQAQVAEIFRAALTEGEQ